MLNIAIFGPPGAGKGTQSKKLSHKYDLLHLSTGELFRKHIKEGTALGLQVQKYIAEGKLVPDEIALDMIEEQILSKRHKCKGFLFDGFPRTIPQARALDLLLEEYNSDLALVLSLEVPQEELRKRIRKRGKELNRLDDQDDNSVLTRMDVYLNETLPVASYYKSQSKFHNIVGSEPITVVSDKINNLIDQFI